MCRWLHTDKPCKRRDKQVQPLLHYIKTAKKKGVAVVAMKTLAGAREMELKTGDAPFEHAAFKWVLQHPEVGGLVVTFKNFKDLDHYLAASGGKFTAADQSTLNSYSTRFGTEYCRTGCGDCESACPSSVRIATTLAQPFRRSAVQPRMRYAGLGRWCGGGERFRPDDRLRRRRWMIDGR